MDQNTLPADMPRIRTVNDKPDSTQVSNISTSIVDRIEAMIRRYSPDYTPDSFTITSGDDPILTIRAKDQNNTKLAMDIARVVGQIEGASMGMRHTPSVSSKPIFSQSDSFEARLFADNWQNLAVAVNQVMKHKIFDGHHPNDGELKKLGTIDIAATLGRHR